MKREAERTSCPGWWVVTGGKATTCRPSCTARVAAMSMIRRERVPVLICSVRQQLSWRCGLCCQPAPLQAIAAKEKLATNVLGGCVKDHAYNKIQGHPG